MQLCRVDARYTLAYLAVSFTYIAMIFLVHMNPARVSEIAMKLSGQGVNVATMTLLLIMAEYSQKRCEAHKTLHFAWALCGLMAVSLAVRLSLMNTGTEERFSIWDSFMSTFTTTAVLFELFFMMFNPTALNISVFVACLVFVVPVLTAVPRWLRERVKPDANVMKRSALMSKTSYSKHTILDASTETAVLTGEQENVVYVAFRGTDDSKNWTTNVNMEPTVVSWHLRKEIRGHAGFYKAYNSVRNKVWSILAGKDPTKPIVFCGHSLGGALATLAAMDFASNAGRNVMVYTFGAPQVGDAAFVKTFNSIIPQCVRVVNPHDTIPSILGALYMHTKGYYPVTTLNKDVFPISHHMNSYLEAIGRPRALSILGMFAPVGYVAVSVAIVMIFHKLLRRHM